MNNGHLGKVAPNCGAEDMATALIIELYPPGGPDTPPIASNTVSRENCGGPEPNGIDRCLT